MGLLSWQKLLLILIAVMFLFGKGKVSDFMGDIGKGIKAFKKGLADDDPETEKKEEKTEPREELKRIEHQLAEKELSQL